MPLRPPIETELHDALTVRVNLELVKQIEDLHGYNRPGQVSYIFRHARILTIGKEHNWDPFYHKTMIF
jgi:hypothetical protein